jgi:hypothetical protein
LQTVAPTKFVDRPLWRLLVLPKLTRGPFSCTSFAQSLLKFIAQLHNKNCLRRNRRQKLIAKSRDMTGFDEWMCMPTIGTRLAPSWCGRCTWPTTLSEE